MVILKPTMLKLNQRQQLVIKILEQNTKPMSAYEILSALQPFGVNAPIMVYRVLKVLINKGYIHRIECQNTYVTCQHHQHERACLFLICKHCGHIDEVIKDALHNEIENIAHLKNFSCGQETIEILGLCIKCKK